jgi:hypothetical protein
MHHLHCKNSGVEELKDKGTEIKMRVENLHI